MWSGQSSAERMSEKVMILNGGAKLELSVAKSRQAVGVQETAGAKISAGEMSVDELGMLDAKRLQTQTITKQGLSVEELSVMQDDARPQTQDVLSMREEEMQVDESGKLDAARLQTQDMTMSVAELSVQDIAKPKTLSVAEYHPTETSQMSEEITCRVQGLNENELGVQYVSGGAESRLSLAPALRNKKVPDVQDDVRPKTGQVLVSVEVLSQSEMIEM